MKKTIIQKIEIKNDSKYEKASQLIDESIALTDDLLRKELIKLKRIKLEKSITSK